MAPSHAALEGDGPSVPAVDGQRLVGPLETAVAESPQDDVLADSQDDQIGVTIAVDVQRVGPGDRRQVGDWRCQRREAQGPADRAVVVVQRGRLAAAGEEQFGKPVVVAVEGGHSAADEVLEVSGVLMVDRSGLIDEMWCT